MSTSERQPNRPPDHLTDAELNELVDGTLAGRDYEKAQTHLADCAECVERHQALLATVSALKQAPSVMPRRSFQLTPEQAKLPEPKHGWLDRFAERLLPGVPALKAATIAVALLFISVTAFDVLTDQSAHDSMGPSAIQREADLPAPAAEAPQTAATELPVLQDTAGGAPPAETDSDGLLEESAPTGGAENASAPSTEAASGAAPEAASESESADESFESSAMQEAPAAPATTLELAPASPTAEPTAAATSAPEPPATSTPTATPVPDSSDGKGGFSLSWWRIAELSLLMVLIWLIVTWIGRRGVGSLDE